MSDYVGSQDIATLQQEAVAAAQQYGVPTDLFTSIIQGESGFNPNAVNPLTGAEGLGQILPSTANQPGYGLQQLTNPLDPQSNLNFAAQYLQTLYQKLGTWIGAVAAYSGTPAGSLPYAGNNQQNNIVNAALAADQSAISGGTAPAPANPAFNQATGATTPAPSWIGSALSSAQSGLQKLLLQGGGIILGVVVIGIGLALLAKSDVSKTLGGR